MTMPRKGSRAVDVDEKSYRFMVRRVKEKKILHITIESATHPGMLLAADLDSRRCPEVTPAVIGAIVRESRVIGWEPEKYNRGTFTLGPPLVEEALNAIGV